MAHMARSWPSSRKVRFLVFIVLLAAATQLVLSQASHITEHTTGQTKTVGNERLVSIEPLPELNGQMCPPDDGAEGLIAAAIAPESPKSILQDAAKPAAKSVADRKPADVDRPPLRTIHDPNPMFSAIAVEPESNMLVVTDENLFQVVQYDRRDNTPPNARMTEPKRVIGGTLTQAEMMCGVYIDPKTLETYIMNNDTQPWLPVFSKDAKGNVKPDRSLKVPSIAFGIAVDELHQEMYLTLQNANMVVAYRKQASGNEKPLRTIVGNDTHLEDPHGIAVDTKRNLMFVANYGSASLRAAKDTATSGSEDGEGARVRGSGRFDPPSIIVYSLNANGNAKPLRLIEGPKTTLHWPSNLAIDEEQGELYVANDMDHSVVVFGVTDQGDVAPRRAIRGPKTGMRNPTGIALDLKNREVWVSNIGNHTAAMFPMSANGDVAPTRVIRGGASNQPNLIIGNPGGVGYDTKREQILVPN
jgi:DNA-binding beta-propeller fold protein YncE